MLSTIAELPVIEEEFVQSISLVSLSRYYNQQFQYFQQDPGMDFASNLNYATTLLQPGHHLGVPSLYTPAICAANAVSPRHSCFVPCLPNSKAADQNGVNWLPSLAPTQNEYPNDEVTSTDRSPLCKTKGAAAVVSMSSQSAELTEEVASSDGTCKRQRLLDGGYKKSSSIESRWPNDNENDVGESCLRGSLPSSGKDKDSSLSTRERKVKIRETLRILESMLPGIKSKDPLLVIDEAIGYLKSLRGKAKALGVELPQEYPPAAC
ncbi:hypothetical protein HAX54_036798 [Datura stramonium]|uniref:BHLH domain-containing protein n=1 Tax=Datura stramonium TaxID=4076 RepID=A0ABS8RME8_DATST|nr:hypothetical protein [Datura stramonium]